MGLILYPPKTPIAFTVFDFPIHYYGIIMACVMLLGIFLSSFLISKKYSKHQSDTFLDFIPSVIIFSIIGARLFYVVGDIDFYFKKPIEVLLINHGGLSFWGGLIFGIASFIFFAKKNHLNLFAYFDILALVMPLCQALGRLGNYFNQEAYGLPYEGPLKLYVNLNYRLDDFLDKEFYHPTFLYESILNLLVFIILLTLFLKVKNLKEGSIFYLYLIFYSIVRIIVEYFRIDSVLSFGEVHIATIISFLVLIISLFLFSRHSFNHWFTGHLGRFFNF